MLNEDKIRIMSRCAMYEKADGKEDIAINHYFRGDYIRLNTLKTWIGVTIAFVMCVGIYAVMNAQYYVENLFKMDFLGLIKEFLVAYILVLVVFGVISVVFYGWKYADSHKRILWYYKDLETLKKMDDEGEENE